MGNRIVMGVASILPTLIEANKPCLDMMYEYDAYWNNTKTSPPPDRIFPISASEIPRPAIVAMQKSGRASSSTTEIKDSNQNAIK